jgi:hypothetical protein
MLGTLDLPLREGRAFTVIGGPFTDHASRYPTCVGVKMAKEIDRRCDISIPTRDFNVPSLDDLNKGLEAAVNNILAGKPVYIGCMAGRGRTGLFMAILAKAFGIKNPVEYVRANYFAHAVETDGQYQFVMGYPIPEAVQRDIKWARVKSYIFFWRNQRELTNLSAVL